MEVPLYSTPSSATAALAIADCVTILYVDIEGGLLSIPHPLWRVGISVLTVCLLCVDSKEKGWATEGWTMSSPTDGKRNHDQPGGLVMRKFVNIL